MIHCFHVDVRLCTSFTYKKQMFSVVKQYQNEIKGRYSFLLELLVYSLYRNCVSLIQGSV